MRLIGTTEVVPLKNLPGLKARSGASIFTGLKAGAFTVVPLCGT